MLPTISKPQPSDPIKVSTTILKARTLKQQLITPDGSAVPSLKPNHPQTIHQPVLIQQNVAKLKELLDEREDKILDGFSLLDNVGMALPDDAIFGVLSDKKYTGVAENDLIFFIGLLYLDVSENFLQLFPFKNLPKLQELRLACNNMKDIYYDDLNVLGTFPSLQFLDLSYNNLSVSSVQALECLPCLRELNLTGNLLWNLPNSMDQFCCLEKLLLQNNKFEGTSVLHSISTIPNLREVSLAYNFLSEIPRECCKMDNFRLLETLDLAFNYFGTEDSVQILLDLTRLRTLILYGNPLLGPSGEDPHYIYIEALANAALDARESSKPIEIITEIPRKRTYKKGEDLGRRLLSYKNFQMALAKKSDSEKLGGKSARDWIEEGNNTLFSQAIAIAQLQYENEHGTTWNSTTKEKGRGSPTPIEELTFLTRAPGDANQDQDEDESRMIAEVAQRGESIVHEGNMNKNQKKRKGKVGIDQGRIKNHDEVADSVMRKIAGEHKAQSQSNDAGGWMNNLRSSDDLALLRSRVMLPMTSAMRAERTESEQVQDPSPSNNNELFKAENDSMSRRNDNKIGSRSKKELQAQVPGFLLGRSMTQAEPLVTNPIAVSTAIKALRFAMRHPMSNYSEIPSKTFMAEQDHQSATAASGSRKAGTQAYYRTMSEIADIDLNCTMPNKENTTALEGYGTGSSFAHRKSAVSSSRRISSSKSHKEYVKHQKEKQNGTLQNIDDILNKLNVNSRDMAMSNDKIPPIHYSTRDKGEDEVGIGLKARQGQRRGNNSTTEMNNLIQMVNEVVSNLA